jgi:hypothetical protein
VSYGLQVWNQDGRKQIDTDEIAPNTYLTAPATTAYSAMSYPPSGFAAGDLVCARPVTYNQVRVTSVAGGSFVPISVGRTIGNVQQFFGSQAIQNGGHTEWPNTAGIKTALIKTQSGNISAPASGEYGMDIYAPNGTTILFSATRSTSVTILAQGVLSGGQTYTYTPHSSLDYDKVYAVVNSTLSLSIPQAFLFPSWSYAVQYKFFTTASTPYIVVQNTVLQNDQIASGWLGGSFAYMLVYDPN